MIDREAAYALVCEYTQGDGLRKHMLAVEAAMRAYARKFGEDEEKWGVVGLLHDFDYERWPNPPDHPLKGSEILAERGYPEDVIYAIKSHADYLTDCHRQSMLDKTLYACDELAGLSMAVAKIRPDGLRGMKSKSVKKKMKQKMKQKSSILFEQTVHPLLQRCSTFYLSVFVDFFFQLLIYFFYLFLVSRAPCRAFYVSAGFHHRASVKNI